jgi:histone H1/5
MASRREHEGRVKQPGVPSGPRNTPKKAKAKKKEVAGPYRSQSSVPSIRKKATKREHRKVAVKPKRSEPKRSAAPKSFKNPLKDVKVTTPQLEYVRAKTRGEAPSAELKRLYPRAYAKANQAFGEYHAERDAVKPDPLAELAISTAATAGIGGIAGLAGKGAKAAGTALASKEASVGESLAEKALKAAASGGKRAKKLPAKQVRRVKTAPKRAAAKVKAAPRRVKEAPKAAKKAATTKEGRRAASRSAARTARKHPLRSGYAGAVVLPEGTLPGDATKRARAFAEGTAAALTHPGKVAETTAHGALGFFTGPLALGGAAVKSVSEGSPAPLVKEGKTLAEGTAKMVGNLASGDPKKVEETTLQETGLVPFIPVPHVVRRLKGTKAYEDARGRVRAKVEGKRAKTREGRVRSEKAAQEAGDFVPRKKVRKVKQPVSDTARPGEKYVLRKTGKLIEKQRSRHSVSREVTRMQTEGELAGKKASESVAKPLRKSKGTNQKEQNDGEALRIFVNHGLPANEALGTAYVKMLHDNWPEIKHGDVPAGVHLDRHSTKFILDHPEIFRGKRGERFFQAVQAFNKQAKTVGTSRRNQYLAQVNNVINPIREKQGKAPLLKPEEMVEPETIGLLPKRNPVEQEWSRKEALDYAQELSQVTGSERAAALKKSADIRASMEGLMKPPEHGGAEGQVSTTQAVAYTDAMEKRFVDQAKSEHPRLNLVDPAAYTADKVPSGLRGEEKAPSFEIPLKKIWPSNGKASMSGNALSDFESLMFNSVESPRARAATVRGLNRVFDKASREIDGKRYLTAREVERAVNTHQVPDGTIFVRTQALKSLLEGEHTVNPEEFLRSLEGEIEHGQALASGKEIAAEMQAAKAQGVKGEKFAPMDAVAIHELMGHFKGISGIGKGIGKATNATTRVILNSPAFEAAQFAQEGLPMAAALGRDVVNVPKAIAAIKEISKLDPETQAQIRAVYGSSVGVQGAPSLRALNSDGYLNPIRAAGRKSAWRHAWEVVNGTKLGNFDKARAGYMREGAGIAKFEGDFRKAAKGFNLWRRAAGNLFKDMEKAVDDMRGLTPGERQAYMANHPKLAERVMKNMNQMGGNWNSFTVFEKNIQPFAIFYPFQRYSVLWTLYHFPLDHPIVATALAMAGQVNAQELQKIAAESGSEPSPLDYTKPAGADGILPAGQRFSAVLGSVQQAVLEGKPSQALSSLSPALGIPLEAIQGKNNYTGQGLGESGWTYLLRQGANLSPFARFLGIPDIGSNRSVASQTFGAEDPNRDERSFFNPYIGQSAQDFAGEKKLERSFDEKYGEGRIPGPFDSKLVQDLLYGGPNSTPQPELLPEALRKIHAAESASDYVKRKEAPFLPPGKDFSDTQKKLLEALENAWQTGPNAEPEESTGGKYGGSNKYSAGNKYLGANKYSSGNKYLAE